MVIKITFSHFDQMPQHEISPKSHIEIVVYRWNIWVLVEIIIGERILSRPAGKDNWGMLDSRLGFGVLVEVYIFQGLLLWVVICFPWKKFESHKKNWCFFDRSHYAEVTVTHYVKDLLLLETPYCVLVPLDCSQMQTVLWPRSIYPYFTIA